MGHCAYTAYKVGLMELFDSNIVVDMSSFAIVLNSTKDLVVLVDAVVDKSGPDAAVADRAGDEINIY